MSDAARILDRLRSQEGKYREMAALIPHATVRILRGQGHSCLVGGRVDVRAILGEWFGA